MVTFKKGDKVKIPKTKNSKSPGSDTYEGFVKFLENNKYTEDYLTIAEILISGDIRTKFKNIKTYTPLFSPDDLELYEEHITHELW